MIPVFAKIIAGVVGPALNSFFDWKSGETKKEIHLAEFELMKKSIEANIRLQLAREMNRPESEFKRFMLEYEGKASDMPRWIQILRGSVRPIITYWSLGIITWLVISGEGSNIGANLKDIPSELWYIFLAVFGFWFGGRAWQHAIESKNKGQLMSAQAEASAQVETQREVTKQEYARQEAERMKIQQELYRAGAPITAATHIPVASSKNNKDAFDWSSIEFE